MSDWTLPEREAVDAVIEHACALLWSTKHEGDTLDAGKTWETIQEWVKAREDAKASEAIQIHPDIVLPPILSPMEKQYAQEIEYHRAIVQYCIERGFIAACDLHFGVHLTLRDHIVKTGTLIWRVLNGFPFKENANAH